MEHKRTREEIASLKEELSTFEAYQQWCFGCVEDTRFIRRVGKYAEKGGDTFSIVAFKK
jgi:hypothetical protein